jgi:hypothetical protein
MRRIHGVAAAALCELHAFHVEAAGTHHLSVLPGAGACLTLEAVAFRRSRPHRLNSATGRVFLRTPVAR